MNLIYIGKLVNTHGLKGEVRIISDFEYKEKIFIKGIHLYIGKDKEEVTIESYRPHKSFDMCVFKEYSYINDVLKFKGQNVYVDREELKLNDNELLDSDYISLRCAYKEKIIGYIEEVVDNNGYKLFNINGKYIPKNENFIEKVDLENKTIYLKNLEGLI